ncbi:hypothetical protein FOB82_02580 [Corynebacterium xerosis]|uniref:BCCT family transporter n=1 Tax=Corynebacterium xerosis TaxID=1725 RepID=A0A6B8TM20_9CORY|nr:BCCT family transporter [Corynebacterium xerosis]QGS33996.1 hypothetical protein FOB82_02580 [Corynebacterium xerosis]
MAAPALILVLAIAVWATAVSEGFGRASSAAFTWLVDTLGWAFIIAAVVFFIAMIALAFSSLGHIRLGRDGEKPEFSTGGWIAMMFAAGMGIGLLFYGGYEPLYHHRNGVPGRAPGSPEDAFAHTLLHWGPIAWATYAVVGGAIAYSTFRMGRPQLISASCTPLIGERRARGWLGNLIDVMAIFGTAIAAFVLVAGPTVAQLDSIPMALGSHLDQLFEMTSRSAVSADGTAEPMLFALIDELPWPGIVSVFTMVLLATFFITTADSASTVMGTMSQRGRVNPTPWVTGVWGLMTTLIAVAMLPSGGTDILSSLQTIIIVAGSPFLLVVIALLVSFIRGVSNDPSRLDDKAARTVHLRMMREQRRGEKSLERGTAPK